MKPLYLRREPTTDAVLLKYEQRTPRRDVVAYHDANCTALAGRWPWHRESRPTRRNKSITLNCARRSVVWLPDADEPSRFDFPRTVAGLVLVYKGLERVA